MDENKTKKYFGVRYSIALGMKGVEGNLRDAGLFTISRDSSLKSPPKSSPVKQRYSLFSKSWLSPKKPEVNNELIAGLGEFKRELKQCMDDEKYHSQNNYKREKQFVRGSEMYEILFHSIPLVSLPEENRGNMRAKLVSVYHNLEVTVFVTYESANPTKTIVASKLFELGTTSLSDKTTIQVDLDKNFLCYKIAPNCELLCAIYDECNSETGEEKLFLGFYKYPSMEVYDLIGPIEGVSYPSKQPFDMHFSYLHKENDESTPDYLLLMFKERIFAVDFSDWNWKDRISFELTDLTPEGYSGLFDNFTKLDIGQTYISEAIKGDQDRKELMAWRWSPYEPHEFQSLNMVPISLSMNSQIIADSVSADGNCFYGFSVNGKDIFKVDLQLSKCHFVYQFCFEDKYITNAKVIKDGKFILTADSTNDLMVYYLTENNTYDMLNCFDFSEQIWSFDISWDNEVIYVLKDQGTLVTIPIHLGREVEIQFIRADCKYLKVIDMQNINQSIDLGAFSKIVPGLIQANSKSKFKMIDSSDHKWDINTSTRRTHAVRRSSNNESVFYQAYWTASTLLVEINEGDCEMYWIYSPEESKVPRDSIEDCYFSCDGDFIFVIYLEGGEIWNLQDDVPKLVHEYPSGDCKFCASSNFVYRCLLRDEQTSFETFCFNDEENQVVRLDGFNLEEKVKPLRSYLFYDYDIMVIVTETCVLAFDEDPSSDLSRHGSLAITRIIDPQPEIVTEDCYMAILDKRNRALTVVKIDPELPELIELSFEVNSALLPIRTMCFSNDTQFLIVLDSQMVVKVYSIELQRRVASIPLERYLNSKWDLSYFCTSVNSKELICLFKNTVSNLPKHHGFVIIRIPFYNTKYDPMKSVLGSYVTNYFSSETYSKKDVMARTILTKIKTYEHYQVTINGLYMIIIYLMDHPSLIEDFALNYLDFNLVSKICLPLIQHNFKKHESLKSYMALFTSYCKDLGECPYIDEKILLRLLYSEGIQIQNRYTRALIGKVLFAPVKTMFGELINEEENVAVLEKNFTKMDVEVYGKNLMAKDPSNLKAFTCCISKIPLDLSNGSQFSVSFFGNIDKFSDEDIREKYRVFIYYKWRLIYFYALAYAIVYWFMNVIAYLYFGRFIIDDWVGWLLMSLNIAFLIFEMKCIVAEADRYFKRFSNIAKLSTYILSASITLFLLNSKDSWEHKPVHAVRMVAAVLISIRGISQLRIFKQTRYIVTMLTQVFIDVYPFMVVFVYVILIMTLIWILEPVLEATYQEQLTFQDAIGRLVNIAFGNFYLLDEDNSYLKFFILIILNIVVGLVLLNFLIALISATYDSIDQKRDLYDVREILPVIHVFDRFFKSLLGRKKEKLRRKKHTLQIGMPRFSVRSSILFKGGAKSEGRFSKTKNRNDLLKKNQNIDRELVLNDKKRHFLCLIPEADTNDKFKMIKRHIENESAEIQESYHVSTDLILKKTSDLGLKVGDVEQRLTLLENKLDNSLNEIKFLLRSSTFASQERNSALVPLAMNEIIALSSPKNNKLERAIPLSSKGIQATLLHESMIGDKETVRRGNTVGWQGRRTKPAFSVIEEEVPDEEIGLKRVVVELAVIEDEKHSNDQGSMGITEKPGVDTQNGTPASEMKKTSVFVPLSGRNKKRRKGIKED